MTRKNSIFAQSAVLFGGEPKDPKDVRLHHVIQRWDGKRSDVGIVGIPFDYGVELSGGRIGSARAPDTIREAIKRYGTAYHIEHETDLVKLRIADCGNVVVSSQDSRMTHERVTAALKAIFTHVDVIISLGGGHDLSYATIRALAEASQGEIGGINVDAHLDVRPVVEGRITSGTPFRRLLEEGFVEGRNFLELGIQGHVNAKAHHEWLIAKGGRAVFLSQVREKGIARIASDFFEMKKTGTALFVSVDIDAVAQAFAPGSSAPSPDGLFPQDIFSLAHCAGKNTAVRLFEIMEVNPLYDVDNRTSRLAANIILEFLAGVSCRKSH